MQNISRFVAFDGKEFKEEQICAEYEDEQMALVQREFFKMAKKVDGEYLGIPYWTEEHDVYILKPKSELDIVVLNRIAMVYEDNTIGNKYSAVWRYDKQVCYRTDGVKAFKDDDLNQILLVEFGYGGGVEGCLFDSDFIQIWDYTTLIEKQTRAMVEALSKVQN